MKKLVVLALAALCVVAFTIPSWALEAEFGGYFRTRWWMQENFTGEDETEALDLENFDQRTRLYLTAVFNENLQFVNKFEIDARWGSRGANAPGYDADGDFGADGVGIEVKNSYADFNLGPVNFKVGIQGIAMGSSFLLDNDFAGAVISYSGENMVIPFIYIKGFEGGIGPDQNDFDVDIFGINPEFAIGDFGINPFFLYWMSDDASQFAEEKDPTFQFTQDLNLWFAGLTLEWNTDPLWMWATGIYQGGDMDMMDGSSVDFEGYLGAIGADFDLGGMFSIHGEAFYASGDDDPFDDNFEAYYVPSTAESYYWSEIMGFGIFDWYTSNNSPADQISNIFAGNLGVTVTPMDKLKVTLDAWYAMLNEDVILPDGSEEDYLGTEVDLVITYQLVEGLNLDVVGAYLFAGDATTMDSPDDADPYLVGSRLSLSF